MTPVSPRTSMRAAMGDRVGDARRRTAAAWAAAGPAGRAALASGVVAGALLAGACLFGLWHVLFGFVIKGNPRAGLFGLVLAAVTAALLGVGLLAARRRLPRA